MRKAILGGDRLRYAMTFFAAVLLFAAARKAEAVQASGSIQVLPDQTILGIGTVVNETIKIVNTSTDTGTDGTGNVAATLLANSITHVVLACQDSACTVPLPGTLTFNSCTIINAGISACALDPADPTNNTVKLTIGAGGITLAAGGTTTLVSIQATAANPVTSAGGDFFSRGFTGNNDIQACSSVTPTNCATGGAQGSTLLSFPVPTPTPTPSITPTSTPTPTNTPTFTPTSSPTATNTPTNTPTATNTPTNTPTPPPPTPTPPPVPVIPTPTSPAGLMLIAGLGLSIAWMLGRMARARVPR